MYSRDTGRGNSREEGGGGERLLFTRWAPLREPQPLREPLPRRAARARPRTATHARLRARRARARARALLPGAGLRARGAGGRGALRRRAGADGATGGGQQEAERLEEGGAART